VFHGHPLNGKGLEGYSPLRVKNSLWIKELEAINSIHSGYRPESWRSLNHYIFGFHDWQPSNVSRNRSSLRQERRLFRNC